MKKRKKSGFRKFLGWIFKGLAVLLTAALILSYVSMFVTPRSSAVLAFLGLFFIPILFANILAAVILAIARSRMAFVSLAALLPTLFLVNRFFSFGGGEEGEPNLTVMTYNIGQQCLSQTNLLYQECTDSIVEFVQRADCDIVCLQEVYASVNDEGPGALFDRYPYSVHHLLHADSGKGFGNMILSRYPIVDYGKMLFPDSSNQILYADIEFQGDTLRIYNNHLQSTGVSFTSFVKNMYDRNKLTAEIESMTGSLNKSFVMRSRQVDSLISHTRTSDHPVIICGDFNDTPTSSAYYRIKKGRKDTFQAAGSGFGATYCMLWPLLRIDYMFVPESARVISHQTLKAKYSDHYPVICTLKL